MNQQLEQIANHLRDMQPEMKRMAEAIKPAQPAHVADVMQYISMANLDQCKMVIDILAIRVSDLVGCASELEDASCMIAREISNELCEGRR